MKTKIITLLTLITFVGCTKEEKPTNQITSIDLEKPILIQVEAVHEDGTIIKSQIVPLRF
jgi:hypothetical protein